MVHTPFDDDELAAELRRVVAAHDAEAARAYRDLDGHWQEIRRLTEALKARGCSVSGFDIDRYERRHHTLTGIGEVRITKIETRDL